MEIQSFMSLGKITRLLLPNLESIDGQILPSVLTTNDHHFGLSPLGILQIHKLSFCIVILLAFCRRV